VVPKRYRNLPAFPEAIVVGCAPVNPQTPPSRVLFTTYLAAVRRHALAITLAVCASVAAAAFISTRLERSYEATVTIDVDCRTPTAIIGHESTRSGVDDAEAFLSTQAKLIQSDSVLRPVAMQYGLLPPEALRTPDAPVKLRSLSVARPANTYLILISYRSKDPKLSADVANGIAKSYLNHVFDIRHNSSASVATFMTREIQELKTKMDGSAAELLRYEREMDVVNPEQKTTMVGSRLMQLNTEFANAQADRLRKEAAYQSITSGQLEAAEVSSQGESLRLASERVQQAEQHFGEVAARYGTKHPEYLKAQVQLAEAKRLLEARKENVARRVGVEYREALNREAMVAKALTQQKAEFDRLNGHSMQYQALRQSAEADRRLYEELVRKIKEASINSEFRNSAIRVADAARPPAGPVFPNTPLNIALAFVLSLFASVVAAVLFDSVDDRIHDADQISRDIDTDVIGTLPKLGKPEREGMQELALRRTEVSATNAGYQEAIRALRVAIVRSDPEVADAPPTVEPAPASRSVLITSAVCEEGKSTVALEVALASARQGHRTLLIDGSMQRPGIHRILGIDLTPGLAGALEDRIPWSQAVVRIPGTDLSVLPAGAYSPRAVDRLGMGMIKILLQAYAEYDTVIVDSPALSVSASCLQLATLVHSVVVIARAGQTRSAQLKSVLESLRRVQANTIGVVLNGVKKPEGGGQAPPRSRVRETNLLTSQSLLTGRPDPTETAS